MRLPFVLALGAAALLASAASAKRPLPTLAYSCSQKVAATAFRVRTGDRLTLYAAVLGKGPTGIVLASQHFSTSCEWVPEAKLLAAHGYRVLVFDYRNTGNSQSVARFAGRENRPRRRCSGTRTATTWLVADRPRRLADRGDRRARR